MVDRRISGRVPAYAAYGGVPEAEAYGNVQNIGNPKTVQYDSSFGEPEPVRFSGNNYPEAQPEVNNNNSFRGVLPEAWKGIKQGAIVGLERFANGLSGGLYDLADEHYDFGARQRRQDLQDYTDGAGEGLGFANRVANTFTELTGALMPFSTVKNLESEKEWGKLVVPMGIASGMRVYDNLKRLAPDDNPEAFYYQNINFHKNNNSGF